MRSLILLIISTLLITPSLSAATVSGEIGTPVTVTPTQIQYQSGIRGTCSTLVKNQKTGKMIKRLVAKKYCAKK
ncbi:hypothetical protein H7170_01910 [Candidatus Gracilibacteria bacterium]|nr:hypothetical protein [Candidatus Gracilibacteria bacterium]